MEQVGKLPLPYTLKAYWMLTKPGIIFGNGINAAIGFALASQGKLNFLLFLATLLGLSCIIASGCIFNNIIDCNADKKMKRTCKRALPQGEVSPRQAFIFASFLGLIGPLLLAVSTNALTVVIALVGFFIYIAIYSPIKYHTSYSTLIGSIAGAVPPVIGYCAVTNKLDGASWILFAMIALWQMPHFFAIAIYRMKDYVSAKIPVLPFKRGIFVTKVHMLIYIVAFIAASLMLAFFGYVGHVHAIVTALLGIGWLRLSLKGFKAQNDTAWARKMFFFSLIVVMSLCLTIPFSLT